MSKRTAEAQINRDNYEDEMDADSVNPGTFKKANEAIIQKRVIKMPKSKLSGSNASTTNNNVFGGFASASNNNMFSGFGNMSNTGNANSTVKTAHNGSSDNKPLFSFGSSSSTNTIHTNTTTNTPSTTGNAPSSSTSNQAVAAMPNDNPVSTTKSTFAPSKNPFDALSSDSTSKNANPTNFQFNSTPIATTATSNTTSLNTTTTPFKQSASKNSSSTFSFGTKEPSVKEQDPIIGFGTTSVAVDASKAESLAKNLRALNYSLMKTIETSYRKNVFFDATELLEQYKTRRSEMIKAYQKVYDELVKNGLAVSNLSRTTASSTQVKATTSSKPVFVFNASTEKKSDETKPSFSFGTPAASKPEFSFGTSASSEKSADTAPSFSFGTPTKTTASSSLPEKTVLEAQRTSLESKSESNGPTFTFRSPLKQDSASVPKSSFTFGQPTAENGAVNSSHTFTFNTPLKPSGGSETAPKSTSPSRTTFETPSKDSANPSLFSLNTSTATTSGTSAFAFKPPSTDNKVDTPAASSASLFSFGSGISTNNTSGFSFGNVSNDGKPALSFNPPSSRVFAAAAAANVGSSSNKVGEDQDGNNEDGDEGQEDTGQATGTHLAVGNEDTEDDTLHQVRTKLMKLTKTEQGESKWTLVGLGVLKLNLHKESGRKRLLLRADGSGRLVLNSPLFPDMKVNIESDKPKYVSFPVYMDSKLTKVYALVKTPEFAKELKEAIVKNLLS